MDYRHVIREFIRDNLSIEHEGAAFSDDDNYFELRFVNSLFAMKLVQFVEQQFGIVVENDELDLNNFCTVNNLVKFVEAKKAKEAG
ncbi:Acyl carrier protein [Thermobacillus xylanilyticus]|jgi:acyl carrier protein|uniref:Acyl carrier protein n=1 Tax=Thermobacillus xylanilyticus TaxID=76633 RepID=A0ABM8V4M9_THEXY|nr:acyl carrier protein [Thermobacillus xylanilyticus]REJ12363.1 MAG: acyl carrier protein [Paenibacillaceae bacterium]CAG5087359.1 Acyl carrier protein [Thermobacillus xylanilyticus]